MVLLHDMKEKKIHSGFNCFILSEHDTRGINNLVPVYRCMHYISGVRACISPNQKCVGLSLRDN